MDRLQAMALVLNTLDEGSFSAAARKTGIPLPTVSRKIAELESHLGAKLFSRNTRKLTLTEAGQDYVAAARRILSEVEVAERRAAGEFSAPMGEVVVTAPVSFGQLHLVPLVGEFLATYPRINVRLLLSDRNLDFIDEHVDLALRIGPLPDSSLVARQVGVTRTVVCGSPELFARVRVPDRPEELADLPTINFQSLAAADRWTFRSPDGGAPLTVPVRPRLSVTTANAALAAAVAGTGLARLLHYQCADAIADGSLRIVLAQYEPDPLPVQLLSFARSSLARKIELFLDFLADRLRRRIGG